MKYNAREKVIGEISPLSHEIKLSIFVPQSLSKSNYIHYMMTQTNQTIIYSPKLRKKRAKFYILGCCFYTLHALLILAIMVFI